MTKKIVFQVFASGNGWCARRADGLVCGFFTDQAGAVRFARRESLGRGVVTIRSARIVGMPWALAA